MEDIKREMQRSEIGFGTWKLKNNEESAVTFAINTGYKIIDTASAYGNEDMVGRGIDAAYVNRENIIIQGKLWNEDRGNYKKVLSAYEKTCMNLKTDYLDVYLIHWPFSESTDPDWKEKNAETWNSMIRLYEEGKVKAIGVCNSKRHHIESMVGETLIDPMVNQIEYHPGFMQQDVIDFCYERRITVQAWGPLGNGKLLKKNILKEIAQQYEISVAQLCIKWCLQNKLSPIVKSSSIDRIKENFDVSKICISNEDMKYINTLPYMGGLGLDADRMMIF